MAISFQKEVCNLGAYFIYSNKMASKYINIMFTIVQAIGIQCECYLNANLFLLFNYCTVFLPK